MENNDMLIQLNILLKKIINILKRENENNWIRAFEKMKLKVDMALDGSLSRDDALKYIKDTCKSIYQGYGSFSDFSIWRDNFKERLDANNEFKSYTAELLDLIKKGVPNDL
jgi:hypothetical protein